MKSDDHNSIMTEDSFSSDFSDVSDSSLSEIQIAKTEKEFEEMILDIDIKRPRDPFTIFCCKMKEKFNLKGDILKIQNNLKNTWRNLSESESAPYKKEFEKEKKRYKEHNKMVKKFLLDKPLKENCTERYLFIEEKLKKINYESNLTREELALEKDKLREEWKNLDEEEKEKYKDKIKDHKQMYEDIKSSLKQSPNNYALFCKDQRIIRKEKGLSGKSSAIAEEWNNLPKEEKEKYTRYAKEELEERKKKRNIYEYNNGLYPKRPLQPVNLYYHEKKSLGEIKSLNEAKVKWEELEYKDKENYLKMHKKDELVYQLRKKENVKQHNIKPATIAFNIFRQDLKGTDPKLFKGIGFSKYAAEKWKNLSPEEKEEYKKRAEKKTEDNNFVENIRLEIEDMKPKKKQISPLDVYKKEKYQEVKEKYPEKTHIKRLNIISEEFTNLSDDEWEKYRSMAQEETFELEKKLKIYQNKLEKFNQIVSGEDKNDKKRGRNTSDPSDLNSKKNENLLKRKRKRGSS